MARQYGTDRSVFNTLSAPLLDPDGLPIVDTSTGFGSSPLGISLREQIQFGLPNATFNLLPPDPAAAISEGENPLPFWQIQTTPNITATATYDTTTQTWGIKVDPGTAPSGDYIELKTRSWVTTDDNIALRQIASLTASKGGTYAGTTQWNLTLSCAYFGHDNTALGTTVIGTVYDNTTWTSISGTTTAGGSAISSSAAWAEFTIKLTATADVSSSTFATLKSLLVATSTPASGGAFVVTDTFNASGTWTRPTGVTTLLAVVGVGGGGGGNGGRVRGTAVANGVSASAGDSGASGASSSWAIIRELYVGGTADASITVGIGTAGAGGAGTSFSKAAAGTTTYLLNGAAGGAGGATTFGSYLTIPGGGGGGTTYASNAGGTAAGAPTSNVYGFEYLGSVAGTYLNNGLAGSASSYAKLPYWETFVSGSAGSAGTATGATSNLSPAGGAAGSAGLIGSGGAGGRVTFDGTNLTAGTGFVGGYGAGSGGGGAGARIAGTQTVVVTGGVGGAGAPNVGGGGGGGGGAGALATTTTTYNASTIDVTSGAGGNGSAGRIYVIYVA